MYILPLKIDIKSYKNVLYFIFKCLTKLLIINAI